MFENPISDDSGVDSKVDLPVINKSIFVNQFHGGGEGRMPLDSIESGLILSSEILRNLPSMRKGEKPPKRKNKRNKKSGRMTARKNPFK